jgi:hypothetical protein
LRRALAASGIDARTVESLIGSSVQALDFGLSVKIDTAPQSLQKGGTR